jgi:hypothetical protein
MAQKLAEAKPQFFAANVENIVVARALDVHSQHAAPG